MPTATAPEVMHHPTHVMLHVDQLVPTPDNPRHFHDDEAFRSLAGNIRKLGRILQPLLARPMPGQKPRKDRTEMFDLRAGERRWRAAKAIGMTHVPVIVLDLDDREAMEVTITENLQRQDLTPLEESDGIQRLLAIGWTVESVAERFSKSPRWVAKRAKLRELNAKWRKAIDDPTHWASRWPAANLEVIAPLPEKTQSDVLDELDQDGGQLWDSPHNDVIPKADALHRWIARQYLDVLSGATWDLGDATLVPKAGACSACPKRASAQPLLFDDDVDAKKPSGDRCLDKACFAAKGMAQAKRKVAELTVGGKPPVQLLGSASWDPDTKALEKKGAVHASRYSAAKAGSAGAVQAVVVHGESAGEVRWVKPAGSGGSASSRSSAGKLEPATRMTMAQKRAALNKRRQVWVINAVRDHVQAMLDRKLGIPLTVMQLAEQEGVEETLRHVCAFGTAWNADNIHHDKSKYVTRHRSSKDFAGWPAMDELEDAKLPDLLESLWRHVLRVFVDRLTNPYDVPKYVADAERIAQTVYLDFRALVAKAELEIPTPRSWSDQPAGKKPKAAKKTKPAVSAREAVSKRVAGMTSPGAPAKKPKASKPKAARKSPAKPDPVVSILNGPDARWETAAQSKQSKPPRMAASAAKPNEGA